jgi:hypothetical protein
MAFNLVEKLQRDQALMLQMLTSRMDSFSAQLSKMNIAEEVQKEMEQEMTEEHPEIDNRVKHPMDGISWNNEVFQDVPAREVVPPQGVHYQPIPMPVFYPQQRAEFNGAHPFLQTPRQVQFVGQPTRAYLPNEMHQFQAQPCQLQQPGQQRWMDVGQQIGVPVENLQTHASPSQQPHTNPSIQQQQPNGYQQSSNQTEQQPSQQQATGGNNMIDALVSAQQKIFDHVSKSSFASIRHVNPPKLKSASAYSSFKVEMHNYIRLYFPEAELSQRLTLLKQAVEDFLEAEIIVNRYELSNENYKPCVNELDRRFGIVRNVYFAAYERWIDLPNQLKPKKSHDNLRLIYDTSVSAIVNIRSETNKWVVPQNDGYDEFKIDSAMLQMAHMTLINRAVDEPTRAAFATHVRL